MFVNKKKTIKNLRKIYKQSFQFNILEIYKNIFYFLYVYFTRKILHLIFYTKYTFTLTVLSS